MMEEGDDGRSSAVRSRVLQLWHWFGGQVYQFQCEDNLYKCLFGKNPSQILKEWKHLLGMSNKEKALVGNLSEYCVEIRRCQNWGTLVSRQSQISGVMVVMAPPGGLMVLLRTLDTPSAIVCE